MLGSRELLAEFTALAELIVAGSLANRGENLLLLFFNVVSDLADHRGDEPVDAGSFRVGGEKLLKGGPDMLMSGQTVFDDVLLVGDGVLGGGVVDLLIPLSPS